MSTLTRPIAKQHKPNRRFRRSALAESKVRIIVTKTVALVRIERIATGGGGSQCGWVDRLTPLQKSSRSATCANLHVNHSLCLKSDRVTCEIIIEGSSLRKSAIACLFAPTRNGLLSGFLALHSCGFAAIEADHVGPGNCWFCGALSAMAYGTWKGNQTIF